MINRTPQPEVNVRSPDTTSPAVQPRQPLEQHSNRRFSNKACFLPTAHPARQLGRPSPTDRNRSEFAEPFLNHSSTMPPSASADLDPNSVEYEERNRTEQLKALESKSKEIDILSSHVANMYDIVMAMQATTRKLQLSIATKHAAVLANGDNGVASQPQHRTGREAAEADERRMKRIRLNSEIWDLTLKLCEHVKKEKAQVEGMGELQERLHRLTAELNETSQLASVFCHVVNHMEKLAHNESKKAAAAQRNLPSGRPQPPTTAAGPSHQQQQHLTTPSNTAAASTKPNPAPPSKPSPAAPEKKLNPTADPSPAPAINTSTASSPANKEASTPAAKRAGSPPSSAPNSHSQRVKQAGPVPAPAINTNVGAATPSPAAKRAGSPLSAAPNPQRVKQAGASG